MEEELVRPSSTLQQEEAVPEKAPREQKRELPPPLPHQKQVAQDPVVTTKRVARVTPTNPLELPRIGETTLYACVTSDALKHAGKSPRFRVPEGFFGLLADVDGRMMSTLLAGEEAEGTFHLHLFRQGTQLMSQHLHGLTSADGFAVNAGLTYGFRFPEGDSKALQDFILAHVLGRTHFSGALLNSDLEHESRQAIAELVQTMNAEELVNSELRAKFEPAYLEALRRRLSASGITLRGLDALS
ncbi:MAG: hypothetical protein KDB07_03600, partial [Planctomycetes bacterium]|nr:hypothetical protein [Planctomycetota bacterium]